MNLIFLDIDGVLNHHEQSWRDVPDYDPQIIPRCVKAFNRIVRETEARIVLSSAWRNLIVQGHMTVYGFERLLCSHGVRGHLISHTRSVGDPERWQEIKAWLDAPDWSRVPLQRGTVDRYCILDDMPDAFGGRPGVRTNGGIGLTDDDAEKAIAILRGEA